MSTASTAPIRHDLPGGTQYPTDVKAPYAGEGIDPTDTAAPPKFQTWDFGGCGTDGGCGRGATNW